MRALSEIRMLMFCKTRVGVTMAQGWWIDLDMHRRDGWDCFILLDDQDLAYWREVGSVR